MHSTRPLLCAALLAFSALPGFAQQQVYQGMCDASAAVPIGAGHFVVADDEGDVLRIYKRGAATPVGTVDLIDFLHNRKPSGKNAEGDIEGAATIGQRIYWISSHALKGKDGEADPHRRRFFATDIVQGAPSPTVKEAGTPYEALLADLLQDPRFALLADAATHKPEDADGLNIEGLAATPDGGLLIGFRNPRPQGRALLIPLLNPRDVVDRGEKPRFGDLIRLDLGGRGIRSIERVGSEVLIAAGPHGPASADGVQPPFALFRWSGVAGQAPAFVRALDAGTFRPEGLFADPEQHDLLLLSDDGDEQVDGHDCKSKDVPLERKSFRALSIPLPLKPGAPACAIDKSASFIGNKLLLARGKGLPGTANVGLFKAPLAVNTDGAPNSYHPDDYKGERLALNHIDNGITIKSAIGTPLTLAKRMQVFDQWRHSGNWQVPTGYRIVWQNVIAANDGKPCVFQSGDYVGYFGSMTALKNGLGTQAAGECAVNDQLDQRVVPSLVLRGSANPLRTWGAAVGDLVLVINPATGVSVPAIIGDSGDDHRIGEGSVALNRALLTGVDMPKTYKQALSLDTGTKAMVVAVLPQSRQFNKTRPYTRENIAERVEAWAQAQGYGSTAGLASSALGCTSGL